MQQAMDTPAFYALEFLGEKFNKMDQEEKIKVMIHELMHIPESFGGGFKNHNVVCEKNVEQCYRAYNECIKDEKKIDWFDFQRKKKKS